MTNGTDEKKPIWKKWWFWAGIVVVLAILYRGGGGAGKTDNSDVIDLKNLSNSYEVIDRSTFDLLSQEGLYGVKTKGESVTGKPGGYEASSTDWGTGEPVRLKLLEMADSEKSVAIMGANNNNDGCLLYDISHINPNCATNPRRTTPVSLYNDYSGDEPTIEVKRSWGQHIVVGRIIKDKLRAVGAQHACDYGAQVSLWVSVESIYDAKSGKRLWPTD